jgi:MFS family permease
VEILVSVPSSSSLPAPTRQPLGIVNCLILLVAAIGFAFDTYTLLIMPLIARPALQELGGYSPGSADFKWWFSWLFYLPAVCGGVFGLLGGYLTDRLGRRRVLTWSILLYAVSAFLAGFSTSLVMLLVFRCGQFIGVCVEFVAAVAWLAELFPQPEQRERVLGWTQAFSSIGGFVVAGVNGLIVKHLASQLPAIAIPEAIRSWAGSIDPANAHAAWRYTLMSGLIPAIPLIVIRPFLPESPIWQAKKRAGTLRRPRLRELFQPAFRRTTIVTTVMFTCSFGAAFGAIQHIQQIVPGLPKVQEAAAEAPKEKRPVVIQGQVSEFTEISELGGLIGRVVLAFLAVRILSRRALLRVFQVPGLILMPLIFAFAFWQNRIELFRVNMSWIGLGVWDLTLFHVGILLAGLFTIAQFSFWGNYLPLVYPVHLRGTGESFAANIGGRMCGTAFAAVTAYLALAMPGDNDSVREAYAAAAVAFFVYLVGSVACFFLPEPKIEGMAE